MKSIYAQSITDALSENVKSSNSKPKLLETGVGREFVKIFNEFPNRNNISGYSPKTYFRAVFVERFNRTITNLLKKLVFEKGNADWISELQSVKKYNNTIHRSKKITPLEASLKKNGK